MSRNRNAYKKIPRNTDTRLTALAAPSAPCFILTPANPARAVSTVVAHSPIGKAGASYCQGQQPRGALLFDHC